MKQLAIPLSNQKTVAKWLVMSNKLDVELTQRSVIRRMSDSHTADNAALIRPTKTHMALGTLNHLGS